MERGIAFDVSFQTFKLKMHFRFMVHTLSKSSELFMYYLELDFANGKVGVSILISIIFS